VVDVDSDYALEQQELEKARLGIEAESFLHSTLGRYLMERADLEVEQATIELIKADAGDFKANRDLRNKIQVAHNFKAWLVEAITAGRVATENISEREAYDS
jgi:hypothetical protein